MALSDAEVESLRFLLGWSNLGIRAYPWTNDLYWESLYGVVVPSLTEGAVTSASVAIAAAGVVTVTPASMADIVPYARLIVDVGEDEETVTVRATTPTTFSARFAKAHAAPYMISVESGLTRCRSLMRRAFTALEQLTGTKILSSAGLKMVGQGEVEWFGPTAVLMATNAQLLAIRKELSSLVRIPLRQEDDECAPTQRLETY
jgi:hypothetical protein